jgi:hypothetical protein
MGHFVTRPRRSVLRRVDPSLGGQARRFGVSVHEVFRVCAVGRVESSAAIAS